MEISAKIQPYVDQTKVFAQKAKTKIKAKWEQALPTIKLIAKDIFLAIGSVACFVTNPTVFFIGTAIGFVAPGKTKEVVEKIKTLVKRAPVPALILTGLAGFLAIQVTWAAGTFLLGAHMGTKLSDLSNSWKATENQAITV